MKKCRLTRSLGTIAACALLVPAAGNAGDWGRPDRDAFRDFIQFAQAEVGADGVAADRTGNVYVSIGGSLNPAPGLVYRISPPYEKSVYYQFSDSGATGLAFDRAGNLYVARTALAPSATTPGVFRVDRHGQAVQVPGSSQMVYANQLAFDDDGNLYVTESFSMNGSSFSGQGGVWRIGRNGIAAVWLRHDLLSGLGLLFPFPLGANGIAFRQGNLYVANMEKHLIVRIPVRRDGNPGTPEIWATLTDIPGSPFFGSPFPLLAAGLALDVHGNAYVAVASRNAIVRINAHDRTQETVAVFPDVPLDSPMGLAFGTRDGERQSLFAVSSGITSMLVGGQPTNKALPQWAGPGLVKIDVGVEGQPRASETDR